MHYEVAVYMQKKVFYLRNLVYVYMHAYYLVFY